MSEQDIHTPTANEAVEENLISITVDFPAETLKKIDRLCLARGLTREQVIRGALRRHLNSPAFTSVLHEDAVNDIKMALTQFIQKRRIFEGTCQVLLNEMALIGYQGAMTPIRLGRLLEDAILNEKLEADGIHVAKRKTKYGRNVIIRKITK